MSTPCCTGINGSHTSPCKTPTDDNILCWCCGVLFPVGGPYAMSAVWSVNGAQCSLCAPQFGGECGISTTPCRERIGEALGVVIGTVQKKCCRGVNGSHEQSCAANTSDRLTCWCCGGTFPSGWATNWSVNGSRCFDCDSCSAAHKLLGPKRLDYSCLTRVGDALETFEPDEDDEFVVTHSSG